MAVIKLQSVDGLQYSIPVLSRLSMLMSTRINKITMILKTCYKTSFYLLQED